MIRGQKGHLLLVHTILVLPLFLLGLVSEMDMTGFIKSLFFKSVSEVLVVKVCLVDWLSEEPIIRVCLWLSSVFVVHYTWWPDQPGVEALLF